MSELIAMCCICDSEADSVMQMGTDRFCAWHLAQLLIAKGLESRLDPTPTSKQAHDWSENILNAAMEWRDKLPEGDVILGYAKE